MVKSLITLGVEQALKARQIHIIKIYKILLLYFVKITFYKF